MIIKVIKILFYGIKEDIDTFFDRSQKKALVEFVTTRKKKYDKLPAFIKDYMTALRIIKRYTLKDNLTRKDTLRPIDDIVTKINHYQNEVERLNEQKRFLEAEYTRILPFGDFSMSDLSFIEKKARRYMQFFCIKTSRAKIIDIPQDLVYVGTDYDLDYYIAVNKEKKHYHHMIEIIIEKSLSQIEQEIHYIDNQIKKDEYYLKFYTRYQKLIHARLIDKLNTYHLQAAKEDVFYPIEAEKLFMVEGWIAENHMKELKKTLKNLAISYEKIAVEERDRQPTYMENKGVSKIGEDLVNIYDTPAITDQDPSVWVYFAFSLFFAMIISDAGYGFLYLFIYFFCKWKFRNKQKAVFHRFTNLILSLSIATIIWGFIVGSFFGINIDPSNPLSKVAFLNLLAEKMAEYHLVHKDQVYFYWLDKYPALKNAINGNHFLEITTYMFDGERVYDALNKFKDNILMECSLLVGALHICLSFLRNLKKHFAGIGWVLFIVGGYLAVPTILKTTSILEYIWLTTQHSAYYIGIYLAYSGAGLAIILSLIQQRLRGLEEFFKVISVFADILSYLRIYALGLAGMIMASTFNELGMSMPIYFGVFVIFVGHLVNFSIGIMGGVIHGLRLNFIEWYHYSFEGDGKLFNPLKLLK